MLQPSDTSLPSVPLAHTGELHLGDLLVAAPLLILMVVGLVLMIRGARAEDDASAPAPPPGPAAPIDPSRKQGPPARNNPAAD